MVSRSRSTVVVFAAAVALACTPPPQRTPEEIERARPPETTSLLGEPLRAPAIDVVQRKTLEANLAAARAVYERTPNEAETLLALGRRTADLHRFQEAVDIFTLGLNKHPRDVRFLRLRGRLFITLRQFDLAMVDLEQASSFIAGTPDETGFESDARGEPARTPHASIWHELGLACYLAGDFTKAERAFREGLRFSKSLGAQEGTTAWLYITLRRLERDTEAASALASVAADTTTDGRPYRALLHLFEGVEPPESVWQRAGNDSERATIASGIGAWHLAEGRGDEAIQWFRRSLDSAPWTATGAIVAEAELHQLGATLVPMS